MARGSTILVAPLPRRGAKYSGVLAAALYPGNIVQIDVSEGFDGNNNFSWELYNADADGNQRLLLILLEAYQIGRLMTTAYSIGELAQAYVPVAGDQLNVMLGDVSGTGDDHVFGDLLIVDDGTGELIATTGSPESEPFILLETVTDPTADQLVHVMYTGY